MSNIHNIETYAKLAEGARFFLGESFHYVNSCLRAELRNLIYSKLIDKIEPTDQDQEMANEAKDLVSENVIEQLKSNEITFLTSQTIKSLGNAWHKAGQYSKFNLHKFKKEHTITSIEILGHLNNFGFFIETLTNRHLLYLYQSNRIDDFCYSRISISKVMERIIFIFKDEITSNKLHLNEISHLFSLRNKTVHYTPDNSILLKPKVSELIKIWEQSKKLIKLFENNQEIDEEKFSDLLNSEILRFKSQWC